MRTLFRRTAAVVLVGLGLTTGAGCELLDPSNVTNPNVTEENALRTPALGGPWLNGLERQTVLVLNEALPMAEIASDNYGNFNNFYLTDDNLDFVNDQHPEVEDLQFDLADLRESAQFGLERVRDNDPNLTNDQLAEFYFFEGFAYLVAGMYFKTLPAEDGGPPVTSAENYQRALAAFDEALAVAEDADVIPSYHLAKARAHYYLGNRTEAVAAADAAIAAGGAEFIRYVNTDPVNLSSNNEDNPDSDIEDAVWERTTTDLQPSPRLDFLDPKFHDFGRSNYDTPIPMLKIEEAHLIKAEAALAAGDLPGARTIMKALLDVVAARPVETIIDTDRRTQRAPGSRPNDAAWQVKRTPDAPAESGLVLTRASGVEIDIPIVSGTSVTAAEFDAAGTVDEALAVLYLLRQEVFFGEGLRMVDLGIKLPVHENEALLNDAVTAEDREGVIPTFLPRGELDAVTLDFEAQLATLQHDLNAILVQNKASGAVVPLF